MKGKKFRIHNMETPISKHAVPEPGKWALVSLETTIPVWIAGFASAGAAHAYAVKNGLVVCHPDWS